MNDLHHLNRSKINPLLSKTPSLKYSNKIVAFIAWLQKGVHGLKENQSGFKLKRNLFSQIIYRMLLKVHRK